MHYHRSEPDYDSDALVTTDQKRKNGKDKRILTIQVGVILIDTPYLT
jgi:hypothetical protein